MADDIGRALDDFASLYGSLPSSARSSSDGPAWGPREALAHLAFWHEQYAAITEALARGAPPPLLEGTLPLGDVMTYPVYRLFISGVCVALALGMWFVFTRTRLGMMIRAGSTNREMVQSLGIDIKVLYRVVFAAGVAIAVLAGMVAAPVSSVYPGMGNQVLIVCFVVVVIGGIGSVRGALLAALLIGIVDTFGKVLLPQAAGVLVYVLMALILLWKPDGLFRAG